MPRYERLYPKLQNDYRFLYNYAVMQFDAGRYEGALRTARECKRLLADYDLCLLTGDIHRALGHTKDAINCYQRAHNYCPVRFHYMSNISCIAARETQRKPSVWQASYSPSQ